MPIECVWHDEPPEGPWQPGQMFPLGYDLSKQFLERDASHRPPISVIVPDRNRPGEGTLFCIDAHPSDEPDAYWEVTIVGELVVGEKPHVTVTPSMHAVGIYHGHLANGVLTDDSG